MAEKTFEQINQHLIFRLGKDHTFIGKEFSYFKLFQHGIVYDFLHTKGKILKTYFHFPLFVQRILWRRGAQNSLVEKARFKENIWLEPGRVFTDESGNFHSMYGEKLRRTLGDTCTSISLNKNPELSTDFSIDQFGFPNEPLDAIEFSILEDLNLVAKSVKKGKYYSSREQAYILSSMHVFFHTFRKYYSILKNQGVKKLFFIAHYHNEGIVAACKKLGIECIELQHGLINKKDLYYVYSNVFKVALQNALMPDKILLYGPYWKSVLDQGVEWNQGAKIIAGNYLAHDFKLPSLANKENLILVASQKGLDDKFIPYIQSLKNSLKNHTDWKIIVKLHPLEKKQDRYQVLRDSQCDLAPIHSSIFHYLERCKIQISIYSTTFFDAAGYDVVNFSWVTSGIGSDYAASLAEDGVVKSVKPGDDIVSIYNNLKHSESSFLQVDSVYSGFDSQQFMQP
jgi:hypothetical protein